LCGNELGLSIRGSEICYAPGLGLECKIALTRVIHCDSSRIMLWKLWLESSHWLESRYHCWKPWRR